MKEFGALSTCVLFFSSKGYQVLPIKDLERPYLRSIANKHGQDEKKKYIDRCRLLSNSDDFNVIVSCVLLWTFPEEPYYNETLTSKTKNLTVTIYRNRRGQCPEELFEHVEQTWFVI